MASEGGIQKPYALAMVICDFIWRDLATGKCSLLGSFSFIAARNFPAVHPSLGVYAAITDGRGKIPIVFQVVDVDEVEEPIFKAESEVDFKDPRAVSEWILNIQGLSFPKPGEYRFQLFAGSEFLLERRLLVHKIQESP